MPSIQDKNKILQEKFQVILYSLLRDEDNKYCVDCDAKGPRWASWNLGVFLCIRCAGIHRNLGVHVSRVKSVNLDSWTEEQIAMMQEIGNSRGRAIYEANIPDHFRRPQTDSALEAFIRTKYEQKKYIAAEWTPPKPKTDVETKEGKTKNMTSSIQLAQQHQLSDKINPAVLIDVIEKSVVTNVESDLLRLDETTAASFVQPSVDLFGDFVASSEINLPNTTNHNVQLINNSVTNIFVKEEGIQQGNLFETSNSFNDRKKVSKDAIMALYGPPQNNNIFGMFGQDRNCYPPGTQQNIGGQMLMFNNVHQPTYPNSTNYLHNIPTQLAGLNINQIGNEKVHMPTIQPWSVNKQSKPSNHSASLNIQSAACSTNQQTTWTANQPMAWSSNQPAAWSANQPKTWPANQQASFSANQLGPSISNSLWQ